MRILTISGFILLSITSTFSQVSVVTAITESVNLDETEKHLTFLASDELRGRNVGTPELEIAAHYIRDHFKNSGLKAFAATPDYLQKVEFVVFNNARSARATIGKEKFELNRDLLIMNGGSINWKGGFVYVGYGTIDELAKFDLKGKMVLALAGSRDANDINKIYRLSREKHAAVKQAGALGLVEILTFPQLPWTALVNFFSKEKWNLKDEQDQVTMAWVKPRSMGNFSAKSLSAMVGELVIETDSPRLVYSDNVVGFVEGTDPELKNEFVIVTAHYDHIGVDPSLKEDSIFNGARDNATGTVALMNAAKFVGANPAKRSVVFVALTAEEKGTLGSQWYTKNPLVPLKQTVLNLNCDGLGYNDKSIITSISLGRTNTDEYLRKAASAFGFRLGGDPDSSEGFYERSDQVSFAKAGVPAIKLQPGLAEMNDEIFRYYHRAADEVGSMDLDYITRFYRSFVYAVYLVSNDSLKPAWVEGDPFESNYNNLHK